MNNAQPSAPVRVIYAKLTSTGDYDVVAKTDNIELNAARSLAEKLLLGNVPHEAAIDEELAYLRPPEGGHLVIRYTTYNWKDEHRGDAFMTDILWLNDADFARARNNAFALVPRTDEVFDVLTALPPVTITPRSDDEDFARASALQHEGDALVPLLAATLSVSSVLAVEKAPVRDRLELFTLLLPPALRPLLTWQTRAFRVPAHVPRITVADAMHANLQAGKWGTILPDVTLDVPLGLATQLVQQTGAPASLRAAHRMYESARTASSSLRDEVARLMGFVALAESLEKKDFARAFDMATAGGADTDARLAEVLRRATPEDVQAAVTRSIAQGGAGDGLALTLLTIAQRSDAAAAVLLQRAACQELIKRSRMPREDLAVHLVGALARAGRADELVMFVGIDRRIAGAAADLDAPQSPAVRWLRALGAAGRSGRDLSAARALLEATSTLDPELSDQAAAAKACTLCREVLDGMLDRVTLTPDHLAGLRALQDAASDAAPRSARAADCIPAMFSAHQLAALDAAGARTLALKLGESRSAESQALLAASLLQRAAVQSDHRDNDALFGAVRGLMEGVPAPMRENVRRTLEGIQVRTEDIVAVQGGAEILPLLGRSAEQATSTRDLLQTVRDLGDSDEAVAKLAAVVLASRSSHLLITRTHQAFSPLRTALSEAVARRRGTGREAPVVEIALDLLASVVDADAFAEIENAALGTGGLTVRLRRLDRAIALCRAAEDEAIYERLAAAIESPDTAISEAARERLRDALGTGGIQRRLIQMLTGVVERGS